MLRQLSKHPSDIAKAAVQYLKTVSVSAKTKKECENVLDLFIESLCSDSSSVVQGKDGGYLLATNWERDVRDLLTY
jgi:hypothetical protein